MENMNEKDESIKELEFDIEEINEMESLLKEEGNKKEQSNTMDSEIEQLLGSSAESDEGLLGNLSQVLKDAEEYDSQTAKKSEEAYNGEEDLMNMLGLSYEEEMESIPVTELESDSMTTEQSKEDASPKTKKRTIGNKWMAFLSKFKKKKEQETADTDIQDENSAILKEMADEDEEKAENQKKVKKEKKSKKVKEKKPKKPKKEKKPKAPKPPKPVEPEEPTKPLPKIPVILTFVFAACFLGIVVIGTNLYAYSYAINQARYDYEHENYSDAYEILLGVEVKEKDQELYKKIRTVMLLEKQLQSYATYTELEMNDQALDSLLKGVKRYDTHYETAQKYGVDKVYDEMIQTISDDLNTYNLSVNQAREMNTIIDRAEYSAKVYEVVLQNN